MADTVSGVFWYGGFADLSLVLHALPGLRFRLTLYKALTLVPM